MRILDSRRLTGPGLLLDSPGAVLDVTLPASRAGLAIAAWENAARRLLGAVGWSGAKLVSRSFRDGITLAISAPVDGLHSATELNEQAWEAAAAEIENRLAPDFTATVNRLREGITAERNPPLVALREAARSRGVTFLHDDDLASVGSGRGVMVWPVRSIPEPDTIDWSRVHDVPMALVTGSNGKTTVVRLTSAMIRAAGKVSGSTSTDGVHVGAKSIEEGDFSGPEGARLVLRRREVEIAILETARGGILRRGIAIERADVAVVTNIAEDHLGEFGVDSLRELAEAKLLVGRAIRNDGDMVLNADDPILVEASLRITKPIIWFSLEAASPLVQAHIEAGGSAVVADEDEIAVIKGGTRTPVARLSDIPITFGGTARYNVANAMAAVAAALVLGIEMPAITGVLQSFGREAADNPGRTNFFDIGGVRVLVDYAHNAHGVAALVEMSRNIAAERRLVMVGSAGDRPDNLIREMGRAASELQPDRVILKDAEQYLRGRSPGEVPELLADEFSRLGTPAASMSRTLSEIAGVREALEWARPGDLLVLAVHQDRRPVLELLEHLGSAGWQAGDPLPDTTASTA